MWFWNINPQGVESRNKVLNSWRAPPLCSMKSFMPLRKKSLAAVSAVPVPHKAHCAQCTVTVTTADVSWALLFSSGYATWDSHTLAENSKIPSLCWEPCQMRYSLLSLNENSLSEGGCYQNTAAERVKNTSSLTTDICHRRFKALFKLLKS